MDKSCHSSGGDSSGTNSATTITSGGRGGGGGDGNNNRDGYLRELNKMSHKIAKPIRRQSSNVIESQLLNQSHANLNQQVQPSQSQPLNQNQNQQQQNQPPVYNINKSDFRDVVQRLTGSPAHVSNPTPPPRPPPIQQTRPPISRLHRIRPPPLAQISNRPPNLLNYALPPPRQPQHFLTNQVMGGGSSGGILVGQRQPLSPLPPLPSVHGAAESPVSAYMRYLENDVVNTPGTDPRSFQQPQPSLLAPRCNNLVPAPLPPPPLQQQNIPPPQPPQQYHQQQNIPPPQPLQQYHHNQQQQNIPPPLPPPPPPQQYHQQQNVPPPPANFSSPYPQFPSSPLPFGCSSPGFLSPSILFSPTGQLGFQQVLSPSMPGPSTKWDNI